MYTDTATYLSKARPSLHQQTSNLNEKDNRLFEGVVVGVGPLENLENTCLVWVCGLNETFKVEASVGNSVSSSASTGEFTPFFKGDKVLVRFINGQQRLAIIARNNNTKGISSHIQQEVVNVPQNGELNKYGEKMQPNPNCASPETAKDFFFDTAKCYPMVGDNSVQQGVFELYSLQGSKSTYAPNSIIQSSPNNVSLTSPVPIPQVEAEIADTLRKLAVIRLIKDQSLVDRAYKWVDNPVGTLDDVLLQDEYDKQLEELNRLQSKLDKLKAKQDCLNRQAKAIRDRAKLQYSTLTTELINIAVEEISAYLPEQFRLTASVAQTDGGIVLTGLSIGDLTFDPGANTITYNGDIFGSYISDGLSAINNLLPDFFQVQVDTSRISLSGTSISLDTLETNLGEKYSLGNNVFVRGSGSSVIVSLGTKDFNVGNFASIRVNPFGKGLSALNSQLPPELQTSVTFNEDLSPVLNIGFLSFDSSTGNLEFDANSAANAITSRVDQNVFSKMPRPVSRMARAAWRHLDLPGLLGAAKPTVPNPNSTIVTKIDCDGNQKTGTPSINYPAQNTSIQDPVIVNGDIA